MRLMARLTTRSKLLLKVFGPKDLKCRVVRTYIYICVYVSAYLYRYVHMYTHINVYAYVDTHIHIYIYVCIYIYTHMWNYICIYIHILGIVSPASFRHVADVGPVPLLQFVRKQGTALQEPSG